MTRRRRSNKPRPTPEWQLKKLRERGPFHGQPIPEPQQVQEEPAEGPLRRAWYRVIIPALIGVTVLFLVGGLLWDSFRERDEQAAFEERAVTTTATVVGVVRGEAEVVFRAEDGARVQTVVPGRFTHEDPRAQVVQYLPENPDLAYREDHRWSWQVGPAVLGLPVTVGLGAGGFLLYRSRSRSRAASRTRSGSRPWRFWVPFVLLIGGILSLPVWFAVDIGLRYAALADSHVVDAPVLDAGRANQRGCQGYVAVEYESHGLRYEERIRISCSDIDDYRDRESVAVEFGADRPDVVRLVGQPPL